MKNKREIYNKLKLFLLIIVLGFTSCLKDTKAPIVTVGFENTTITQGESIKISISNNPDLVTLYSGEFGFQYKHRERTTIESSTPKLNFASYSTGSTHESGYVYFVYSTDYNGQGDPSTATWEILSTNDKSHEKYNESDWGTLQNNNSRENKFFSRDFSLEGIRGDKTYFAFRYEGMSGLAQRRWYITDFIVETVVPESNDQIINIVTEDFLSNSGSDWTTISVKGTEEWVLASGAKHLGSIWMGANNKADDNEDWLIMAPLDLTSNQYPTSPDKGKSIKTINETNKVFEYVYAEPGEYVATVLVNHWDYHNNVFNTQVFEQTITVLKKQSSDENDSIDVGDGSDSSDTTDDGDGSDTSDMTDDGDGSDSDDTTMKGRRIEIIEDIPSPFKVGDTHTMTFKYYNEEGKEEELDSPRWNSSSSNVASIDPANGLVTALKAGTTVIMVRTRGATETQVSDTYEITISDPSDTTDGGDGSDTSDMTDDGDGSDTSDMTDDGDGSDSDDTTMKGRRIEIIEDIPSPFKVGDTHTMTFKYYNEEGKEEELDSSRWSSSSSDIASVDPANGLVTALKAGTTVITVRTIGAAKNRVNDTYEITILDSSDTTDDGDGSDSDDTTMKGRRIEIIEDIPSPFKVGDTHTMTFKYYNEEGKEEELDSPRWNSSSSNVASIDPANGLVTALKAGTTVIMVRTRGATETQVSDTYEITISDPSDTTDGGDGSDTSDMTDDGDGSDTSDMTDDGDGSDSDDTTMKGRRIEIIEDIPSPFKVGDTHTMTFKYYNEEGKEEELDSPRWNSSSSNVASIDPANGLVTALKAGTTVIMVRTRGATETQVSDTYEITISDP